ncbi:hypothetical protein [Streptomyces sp. NPDC048560]
MTEQRRILGTGPRTPDSPPPATFRTGTPAEHRPKLALKRELQT